MPLRDHFRPPLAAVVLLLLEVFERRSGLLSRRGRRAAASLRQPPAHRLVLAHTFASRAAPGDTGDATRTAASAAR